MAPHVNGGDSVVRNRPLPDSPVPVAQDDSPLFGESTRSRRPLRRRQRERILDPVDHRLHGRPGFSTERRSVASRRQSANGSIHLLESTRQPRTDGTIRGRGPRHHFQKAPKRVAGRNHVALLQRRESEVVPGRPEPIVRRHHGLVLTNRTIDPASVLVRPARLEARHRGVVRTEGAVRPHRWRCPPHRHAHCAKSNGDNRGPTGHRPPLVPCNEQHRDRHERHRGRQADGQVASQQHEQEHRETEAEHGRSLVAPPPGTRLPNQVCHGRHGDRDECQACGVLERLRCPQEHRRPQGDDAGRESGRARSAKPRGARGEDRHGEARQGGIEHDNRKRMVADGPVECPHGEDPCGILRGSQGRRVGERHPVSQRCSQDARVGVERVSIPREGPETWSHGQVRRCHAGEQVQQHPQAKHEREVQGSEPAHPGVGRDPPNDRPCR